MSAKGDRGAGCILVLVVCFCSRQLLEAVGRKELPRPRARPDRRLAASNGREIATSASHPGVARSPLALPEDRRELVLVAHPNDFLPSSPCDPGLPGGRRAHLEFPPGDVPAPAVDEHCVVAAARR